jgi:hypothetical protein
VGREEKAGVEDTNRKLPCRLRVQVEGVQAFIYNRSPVYDAVMAKFAPDNDPVPKSPSAGDEQKAGTVEKNPPGKASGILDAVKTVLQQSDSSDEDRDQEKAAKPKNRKPQLPVFLKLFPIQVDCKIGAAVLGNENTKSIISAKCENASGVFDAGHAGEYDVYKQIFDFEVVHPVIQMKPNLDFRELQLAAAARVKESEGAVERQNHKKKHGHRSTRLAWFPFWRTRSSESIKTTPSDVANGRSISLFQLPALNQERWQGLSRYLDDTLHNEHDEWDSVEYARSSTLADVPSVGFTFYWDTPGKVPLSEHLGQGETEDINGSSPPEYGMDLTIRGDKDGHGGFINYGPWADRQRVNLQSIFFPATYANAVPGKKLTPGEYRVSTNFKLFLSIEAETVVRLPMREHSKDWKWKGKADAATGPAKTPISKAANKKKRSFWRSHEKRSVRPNVRPFGWIDIKVAANSSVSYVMDMIARKTGYDSHVNADIRGLEMSTSVNHGLLWRSGPLDLRCDLSVPLAWNTLREWRFDIVNDDLELFILRDHLFLLTDLITDWSSGPPPDFFTFTPFKYLLNVRFRNFKLYLNTNDSNIINNPAELDDNQFVILYGRELTGDVTIPLENFRPIRNEIFFEVVGHDLGLELCLNSRNTVATFTGRKNVAELDEVTFRGSHAYFSETSVELTDRLTFFIHGKKLVLTMFGFVVSHFIKIKENYFGEHLHFRTLEEYQDLTRVGTNASAEHKAQSASNRSNDLDVIMCISAEDVSALLPASMYRSDENIIAEVSYASVDLRITNYYMDLQVDLSPISISHNRADKADSPHHTGSRVELFVDSANVVGHRLFGLPPTEPTYLCNWDIDVGRISGECSSGFVDKLVRSITCFVFSFDDDENAIPLIPLAVVSDITFLRVRTQTIKVWFHVDRDAILVSTNPASIELNDWAGSTFSQRLKILVPDVTLACLDAQSASRFRVRDEGQQVVETHAFLQTTLSVGMLKRKLHFTEERRKQQRHLIESDQRTNRTPFLVFDDPHIDLNDLEQVVDRPAMGFPAIPNPVLRRKFEAIRPSKSSAASSEGHSAPGVNRGNGSPNRLPVRQKPSQASFKGSVRGRSDSQMELEERRARLDSGYRSASRVARGFGARRTDREREVRGLPPSSVALASNLATPYFPLHQTQPDLLDVPPLQSLDPVSQHDDATPNFNDVMAKNLDENLVHTSVVVDVHPAIQGFCKPRAVITIANFLAVLQPKTPDHILDSFQIAVMGQLIEKEKKRSGVGSSLELSLRVPQVAFRFLNVFAGEPNAEVDQFDLQLTKFATVARNKQHPTAKSKADDTVLYCTLESLSICAREKPLALGPEDAAVRVQIDDVLLWLSTVRTTTINTSFRGFEVATASRKVEYLSAMIHRTTMLAESYVSLFTAQITEQHRRLTYLIYNLTMAAADVPDPPFLTRASYSMRAASRHLRNNDSWKIISRLRYIYQNLSPQQTKNLQEECIQDFGMYPTNAESVVLNSWDQWRTWDLAHVRKSLAFRHLYGKIPGVTVDPDQSPGKPFQITLRSAEIRMVVDPGRQQSEIAVHVPVVNLAVVPPSSPSGLMLVDNSTPVQRVTLEMSAKSFIVTLNWHITGLVESTLRLIQEAEHSQSVGSEQSVTSKASTLTTAEWIELQGVFVLESAVVALESMNLRTIAASKNLKVSLLGNGRSSTKGSISGSVVLHADSARSEFISHSRVLLRARSDMPNLYFSKDEVRESSPEAPALMITAASRKLTVELKEEILGMIEVADSIIRDEVAYVQESLMPLIPSTPKPPKSAGIISEFPRIKVALMMDSYHIDFALLQSLIYTMSGKTGRLSVSPGLHRKLALDLNFDLDAQKHDLTSHAHVGLHVISALELPPINGQIKVMQSPESVSLAVNAIVETIVLEASAVHGLLNTLQRPEVSSTFKAVQSDIETIKARVKSIFPESPPQTPTTPGSDMLGGRPLIYNVSATLAGLQITAEAPGKLPNAGVASLAFGLGCVQVQAFNALDSNRTILPLPEIRGRLRRLFAELTIKDSEGSRRCGNLGLSAAVHCTSRKSRRGRRRKYQIQTDGIEVNIYAETASAVVDVLNHLQDRLKELDLSREKRYLQRLRQPSRKASMHLGQSMYTESSTASSGLFTSVISILLLDIQIAWIVGGSVPAIKGHDINDLVLSIKMIDMATKSESSSRLAIEELRLQMVPSSQDKRQRFINSALLPEMVFNVAYVSSDVDRKISFQAAGKSLDLRLEPQFIVPASMLQQSINLAAEKVRQASASWEMTPTAAGGQRKNPFGDKRLASLLVDVDFAGAVVHLQESPRSVRTRNEQKGRYGQFANEDTTAASLRSPGLAVRVEFRDGGTESSLNAELMISASSNTLTPTVVPLFLELSDSIKTVVGETDKPVPKPSPKPAQPSSFLTDESLLTADPSKLLGKTSLNLGVRICSQEFSLSCQPIARVEATARFDDIYITANSIKSIEHNHFFAISAAFEKLQASVQHVYSRESTFSFEMDRIVLSLMNSKHLSGTAGISAILKIYPTRTRINAKQLQDFLLFREIWLPQEIRESVAPASNSAPAPEPQEYLVQRYQQVAAAAAFPWNATIAIAEMAVELDLGQAIGKSSLSITDVWASSRKQTNWEQNLCIGIGNMSVTSTGRMSGFVELAGLNIRTMIAWPNQEGGFRQTPRIQASIGFRELRVKAAFDYQAFAIGDVSKFTFLMYNVKQGGDKSRDRLVAILDGEGVHAFCTATSAAQGLALYQAFERLIQENQVAYAQSLKDIEKYLRRQSVAVPPRLQSQAMAIDRPKVEEPDDGLLGAPISLYTDVVVTLKSINLGAFPSAFSDNQIFLIEASDVQARFAVMLEDDKIHSGLGMTLGQLRVALAGPANPTGPKSLQEITVEDVVQTAKGARGGTILRVPKVVAAMQTWQIPASYEIEYIFRSSFEGKVDVGWNYARIGFIRGMWNTHSKALASRLGKPLPESAVKITTGEPSSTNAETTGEEHKAAEPREGEKITAVVNVPQSKYEYFAREPPIIETPQLRDMGEATPPLEWIGLHRERLPNLTHQIVIVSLLGVAKEVEDAYGRILGSS